MNEKLEISLDTPASKIELLLKKPFSGSNHIIMRPLELHDAPEIVFAVEESLNELKKYMPWAHFPQTIDGQRKRIIENHHKYWAGKDFGFGIFASDGKKFLGGCGLHPRTLNLLGLEIGYWIRTSFAGQGLCTEITKALTVYCFSYLGLSRLQCGFDVRNIGSERVIAKCGFKTEGILRDFCPLPAALADNATDWDGSGDVVMTSLLRGDVKDLEWYGDTFSRLKVFDWLSREANPAQKFLRFC